MLTGISENKRLSFEEAYVFQLLPATPTPTWAMIQVSHRPTWFGSGDAIIITRAICHGGDCGYRTPWGVRTRLPVDGSRRRAVAIQRPSQTTNGLLRIPPPSPKKKCISQCRGRRRNQASSPSIASPKTLSPQKLHCHAAPGALYPTNNGTQLNTSLNT